MRFKKILTLFVLAISLFTVASLYPSPAKADTANNYNITIDGNFEDWADKPKTDIFFDYNNGNVTKQGSFLSDDKYLYIYIDMDPYNKGHNYRFQGSGWNVQVGNNITSLTFSVDGGIWSLQPGSKAAISSVWSWSNNDPDKLFINQQIPGVTGYVTTEKSSNGWAYRDRAEIKIPLSGFLKNADMVRSLIIYDTDNMGQQKVTVTGASTGGNLIVLSGFIMAILLVLFGKFLKNRKRG
ncbi:Firmicu-CTERM sorting domain-containing protein [Leuconostoc suionicum]|uniref:Firmicu-CTERM sorting domain-containing protein n=1 Tax=Leuconostoc suionicum TaxID=1511761 RepID=UPI0032DF188F